MPNPSGPDRDDRSNAAGFDPDTANGPADSDAAADPGHEATEAYHAPPSDADPATEVMSQARQENERDDAEPKPRRGERRFTAPGFDAKETTVIDAAAEPATEVFRAREDAGEPSRTSPRTAMPQVIPPRLGSRLRPSNQSSWGWVLALILIILALAAIAVLGTVLLTHGNKKRKASQEEQVRSTIQTFDVAVQNEYPVVASVDQVVVNDGHAEANVTAFMAYA
ncbi:MAG: hypothetical protein J2P16_13710, partial [Mycobacterium sp.]|nr:hypothetical protein [Mycobacterium sp.]